MVMSPIARIVDRTSGLYVLALVAMPPWLRLRLSLGYQDSACQ